MIEIGVQTKNIVDDICPSNGFSLIKKSGFDCADFSLNSYLSNISLYSLQKNKFFDGTISELEQFFTPHRKGAQEAGIRINQMHMPYPNFVPNGSEDLNDYLSKVVAPKSMQICSFFGCSHIVVHGFKLARFLGSEEAEWNRMENFLSTLAPLAKELNLTLCLENIYSSIGNQIIEGPCCNVHKMIDRIDRFNDKYSAELLGFCFDTGHAKLVGLNFEDFITNLDFRLKVLHIHDNDGIGDLHQLPFTFTKNRENACSTDWSGFIKGMRNVAFDKVLSFETAPVLSSFPGELKNDVLSLIAKVGRYFSDKISRE